MEEAFFLSIGSKKNYVVRFGVNRNRSLGIVLNCNCENESRILVTKYFFDLFSSSLSRTNRHSRQAAYDVFWKTAKMG